jgi:hypothetical protein
MARLPKRWLRTEVRHPDTFLHPRVESLEDRCQAGSVAFGARLELLTPGLLSFASDPLISRDVLADTPLAMLRTTSPGRETDLGISTLPSATPLGQPEESDSPARLPTDSATAGDNHGTAPEPLLPGVESLGQPARLYDPNAAWNPRVGGAPAAAAAVAVAAAPSFATPAPLAGGKAAPNQAGVHPDTASWLQPDMIGAGNAHLPAASGVPAGKLPAGSPPPDPTGIPYQFIAKMSSEALGRTPDQGGWVYWTTNYFVMNGCNAGSLANAGGQFYAGQEFFNDYNYPAHPDYPAMLLALYRGALNREPDAFGFSYQLAVLQTGQASWAQVVNNVFVSPEFTNYLIPQICGSNPSYSFVPGSALTIPTNGLGWCGAACYPQGTPPAQIDNDLQNLLNNTPSGSAFYLDQKAVVPVVQPITVPAGVTLTTAGAPGPNQYALMGRLVREALFMAPVVTLQNGAALDNVWVEGSSNRFNYSTPADSAWANGPLGDVSHNRFSNSAGGQHIVANGSTTVLQNLITGYATRDPSQPTSDGVGAGAGSSSTVVANGFIDFGTQVGVVLFGAPGLPQRSVVHDNTFVQAGNQTSGFIAVDPLSGDPTAPPLDFNGTQVFDNTMWTSPSTSAKIAILDGTRALYAPNAAQGTGAALYNNSAGVLTARVNTGIAISGMFNTYVQGNFDPPYYNQLVIVPISGCPRRPVWIDSRYASGSTQATAADDIPVDYACF